MERTILQRLIEWKKSNNRKPLILNGTRQVGKTWILREFAQQEYRKEAYIVCRKNEYARMLFTKDFDVERILRGLRALTSIDMTPGDTLVITNDSRLELDFVIQQDDQVLPIEAKAEGNVRANSLTTLLAAQPTMQAVRYSMLPYRRQEQLSCVPLYMIM